ncbi:hypothetical protein C1J05_04035 [Sulfitobacter sp. JL08]|nr:hypothetical protein C1J05_04035 [Sulfitobacter sp. JL08]
MDRRKAQNTSVHSCVENRERMPVAPHLAVPESASTVAIKSNDYPPRHVRRVSVFALTNPN